MEKEKINEQQDSIEVTKNTKGFSWNIKRYYDHDQVKPEKVITEIEEINEQLKTKFGGEPNGGK